MDTAADLNVPLPRLPCLIPQAGRKNEVLRPVQGDTRVAEKTSPSSVKASIEKKLVKALSLKQESGDEVVRGAKLRRKSDSSFSALSNSELEDYLEQGSRQSVRPIRINELGVLDEGMKPPQRGRPPKGRRQHERVVLQDQDDLFEEEDWMESPPPRKGGRQQAPQRGRRAVPDEDEDRTFGSQRQRRLENDGVFRESRKDERWVNDRSSGGFRSAVGGFVASATGKPLKGKPSLEQPSEETSWSISVRERERESDEFSGSVIRNLMTLKHQVSDRCRRARAISAKTKAKTVVLEGEHGAMRGEEEIAEEGEVEEMKGEEEIAEEGEMREIWERRQR
eukprot:751345-Hanusia_phi.AAC.1